MRRDAMRCDAMRCERWFCAQQIFYDSHRWGWFLVFFSSHTVPVVSFAFEQWRSILKVDGGAAKSRVETQIRIKLILFTVPVVSFVFEAAAAGTVHPGERSWELLYGHLESLGLCGDICFL